MKESYWGYWLVVLGIFIVVVLLLVQSFTSTNTQDYYMVKTITEASLEDAIDYSYYTTYGEAKINKEKFEESFIRRFAEEASLTTTYKIQFSDLYEAPPKVSVKVSSKAGGFSVNGSNNDIDIINKIDSILESSEYVSSSSKVVQETMKPVNMDYLLPCFGTEDNAKINALKSCKAKFIGDVCGHLGETEVEIVQCGKPRMDIIDKTFGFKDEAKTQRVYEIDPDYTYCIFKAKGSDVCAGFATYDQLEYKNCK